MQEMEFSEDDEDVIVIPIDRSFSDGDKSTWPTEPRFGMPDDTHYRAKLASLWLEKIGAYENGVNYVLDSLPDGYAVFDRPRGTNPDIRDRFLYGHPIGQYFYSTVQFFPHFYYLMTGGINPCPCHLCEKLTKKTVRQKEGMAARGRPSGPVKSDGSVKSQGNPVGRPPGRPSGRPPGRPLGKPLERPLGRPGWPPASPIVDREGAPDVYRMAIMRLKERGQLDQEISEQASMDWRAERSALEEYLEKLSMQPSYIPRAGEIVLWSPAFDGELAWNPESNRVQIYSAVEGRWLGTPEWRAGVVGQIPEEETVLQDLVETAPKEWSVNYSGFRIETYPDPLSTDKSYSLHYKYVHLKCIKPFNAFELFLQGIPRDELHPSIEYAMTIMSSFSLLDKYHFKGSWPNASIYCRGIYIGAELLVVGDAVRLKPKGYTPGSAHNAIVTDVMVIDEIRLELIQCVADIKSEQLAEKYQVRIAGKVYTPNCQRASMSGVQPAKALSPDEVVSVFQYVGMSGFGGWYSLNSGSTADISQGMVIGRCYEPDALQLLFDSLSLGQDLHGVMIGREYSRKADERIPEGKDWFWGDFRTQTLAIDSLNGEDVGHYSETRDIKMWTANLKVLDGTAKPSDFREAKIPGEVERPSAAKSRSSFAKVRKTSLLVSVGLGSVATDMSNSVSSAEEGLTPAGTDFDEEEGEEDFSIPIELLRGGTEETEGGDYVPEDETPKAKRPKHDF